MSESEATHDGLYFILFLYNIFIITNMYFIFLVFLEPQKLNIYDLINYKLGLPINERFLVTYYICYEMILHAFMFVIKILFEGIEIQLESKIEEINTTHNHEFISFP